MKKNLWSYLHDGLYMAYDKIAMYPSFFCVAGSDAEAVRKCMLSARVPLKDSDIYYIGSFRFGSAPNFNSVSKLRLVPWTAYRLPETMAEALAPLDASPEEIQEIINNSIKVHEKEVKHE